MLDETDSLTVRVVLGRGKVSFFLLVTAFIHVLCATSRASNDVIGYGSKNNKESRPCFNEPNDGGGARQKLDTLLADTETRRLHLTLPPSTKEHGRLSGVASQMFQ